MQEKTKQLGVDTVEPRYNETGGSTKNLIKAEILLLHNLVVFILMTLSQMYYGNQTFLTRT